ncbi:hypothetical protein Taro_018668, partial [Colocasia esculenta]|nr:hypothetical protein [Colocasia esculenta]
MAVTYGPLVVNNHARFGYLATPIVFGDFPAVVGSPFFLGVVLARQEEDTFQRSSIHKSTKKNGRMHANTKVHPATVNKGTSIPLKTDDVKESKAHSTQVRTYSVHLISSTIVAPASSQRGQNKHHKSKRPSAATSRSGKSIMVGSLQVRLDGSPPITPRDRNVPNIPTSNRFSALWWFRRKHEDSTVKAGAKQKTRHFTKLKQIWIPKKEIQKFKKNQANASKDTREDKGIPTQQSKARISVFDRISRIPVFDKLRATPSTSTRPSKRRRVTWAAQEKPRLIIFSCYTTGRESGEVAEQIAEATPNIPTEHEGTQLPFIEETNIQLEEGRPSTSASHPVIDLPTKESFQAMSDDDKYEVMQQWRSEMTSFINEMRRLATSSHRQFIEP